MDNSSELSDVSLDNLLQYTMTFLAFMLDRSGPGFLPAGSGTFVELAGLKGILTAGHVLRELFRDEETEFKIAVLKPDRTGFTGIPTDLTLCRPYCLITEPVTEEGPDIGFLTIPEGTVQGVLANWNFHNLDQRLAVLTDYQLPVDRKVVVTGLPAVRSINTNVSEVSRTDRHEILQMVGSVSRYGQDAQGYDTFVFEPNGKTAGMPVVDFRGVSGGAAWVVGRDGDLASRFLHGVAFFQSDSSSGQRYLVCNGPASIYLKLRDKINDAEKTGSLWAGSILS